METPLSDRLPEPVTCVHCGGLARQDKCCRACATRIVQTYLHDQGLHHVKAPACPVC